MGRGFAASAGVSLYPPPTAIRSLVSVRGPEVSPVQMSDEAALALVTQRLDETIAEACA